MSESAQNTFASAAEQAASEKLRSFARHSIDEVLKLPEASAEDIVVAGKEVQLTVFRQLGVPDFPDALLVTAQVVRAGLGGIVTYHHEQGLVFFAGGGNRRASDEELEATRE